MSKQLADAAFEDYGAGSYSRYLDICANVVGVMGAACGVVAIVCAVLTVRGIATNSIKEASELLALAAAFLHYGIAAVLLVSAGMGLHLFAALGLMMRDRAAHGVNVV
jgi:uncharacterized membrane protein